MPHLSFLSKVTFERKLLECGIHTCASFYLQKLTVLSQTDRVRIPESFPSQTLSCD